MCSKSPHPKAPISGMSRPIDLGFLADTDRRDQIADLEPRRKPWQGEDDEDAAIDRSVPRIGWHHHKKGHEHRRLRLS